MQQSIFTVVLPVIPGEQGALCKFLSSLGYTGRPTTDDPLCFSFLNSLHYASLFLYDDPVDGWFVVFECNIDGAADAFFEALVARASERDKGETLLAIFHKCQGFQGGLLSELPDFLKRYQQKPCTAYSGCVGRSRDQIHFEAEVHQLFSEALCTGDVESKEQAIAKVQEALDTHPRANEYRQTPLSTPDSDELLHAMKRAKGTSGSIALAKSFIKSIYRALRRGAVLEALCALFSAMLFGVLGVCNLLRKEPSAIEDAYAPEPSHVDSQKRFENFLPKNHMVSVVHCHSDASRRWAKWSAFKVLSLLAKYEYTNGILGTIPTIHFAHWSQLNNGRRLLFVSNFDGSWDSYLDDFTLKAARGLTLAWAHGIGFPKSTFMLYGGAAKGPEFIDWARRSMVPTLVWYSAYPDLSIRNVNRHSALRQAFAADKTMTNSTNWLELIH